MEERQRLDLAVKAAVDTKAENVLVFDMDQRSSITDYVVICSGRSQGHVRGIAENIENAMREAGLRYSSMEGYQEGSWVLMDFDIFLVHIFHPETRQYYDLESLLANYPKEVIDSGDGEIAGSGETAAGLV